MRLRRQMDHTVRVMPREDRIHGHGGTDIGPLEDVTRVVLDIGQRAGQRGIGHRIHVNHAMPGFSEKMPDQCRAEKAGATGDKDTHVPYSHDSTKRLPTG